jgi:hypothetical protein
MTKPNDDTCHTFAVSTLEPSLYKGCNSPSVERLYSPLFVLNPKSTASCGPLHLGVVRWAGSGGWFDESVMSFLGCLTLGLLLTFSLLDAVELPFANAHNRFVMLTVDRLASPHASLGQVQLDLGAKLCVLCLYSFFEVLFLMLGWVRLG